MKMQSRSRGLRELCRLLGYTPQAYYQHQKLSCKQGLSEDLVIQQVLYHRLCQPRVGGAKLHEMLEPFMGVHNIKLGRDLLFDLLRVNDLLVRKKKRRHPQTTDSNHWMRKYPELIRNIKLTRADELWVSDITYIRLIDKEFGYLSLVTDAYSRKIVGFCMHYDLSARGPLRALQMALAGRAGNQSLIHHSDRGSQYCSDDYVNLLNFNTIDISMTQSGNPKDNAIAERVNGILKQELLKEIYPDMHQARQGVDTAVDIYNRIRLHSSVDMMTPEKAHLKTGAIRRRWTGALRNLRKSAPETIVVQQPGFQQKKEV